MEFDIWFALAVIIAVAIGALVTWGYNKYKTAKIDSIFKTVRTLFDTYGAHIEKDNPELYSKLVIALSVMDKAMSDGTITISETVEMIKTFLPLSKTLVNFIKARYEC